MEVEQEPAATGAPPTAQTVPPDDCFIRFRLSAIDFVPSSERSHFDNRRSPFSRDELHTVPVIRIFGATDRGQRVCAHVHGAFPYVYVEYKGKLDPTSVSDYIRRFGAALNKAMGIALPSKHKKGQPTQYVAFIVPCKGIPFYGYHVGYVPYLKIYIVHPRHKTRLSEVLRSGAVLGTQFDVFEAHVPFLLQFMLDANLFGCGWVEVGTALFREDVPEHVPSPSDEYNRPSCTGPYAFRTYTIATVPRARMHPPVDDGGPAKTSYMRLELDLPVSAILNRRRLTPRNLHHDFVELLHPERVERGRNVRSVRELWEDEQRRRSARGESGPVDIVDDEPRAWDDRPEGAPIWKREPEFRAKVQARVDEDLAKYRERLGPKGRSKPDFSTYVEEKDRLFEGNQSFWLDRIRTAFEQVDAIYVERFIEDEAKNYPFGAWAVRGFGLTVTEAQEASWLHAGLAEDVDVGRLKASQAAGKSARLKRRPQDQVGGSDDDAMEADPDLSDAEEDEPRGDGPPPPTQAEALARARRSKDRAQMRAREASVEEGEWEREPEEARDDEDDGFWGMGAGTDRPPSEASGEDADERDITLSPGSRRSSVRPASISPTKAAEVLPITPQKRPAHHDAEAHPTSSFKKQKSSLEADEAVIETLARQHGPFGEQAASFLPFPASTSTERKLESKPQMLQALRRTRTPRPDEHRGQARESVPSDSRRSRNPFSSPTKGVAIRLPRQAPTVKSDPPAVPAEEPTLFTFRQSLPEISPSEQAPAGRQLQSSPSKALIDYSAPSMRSSAPPIEHFLQSSPSDVDEPIGALSPSPSPPPVHRTRNGLTPSQVATELADLPEGLLDDDYRPTPTVKESGPSQLPTQLRTVIVEDSPTRPRQHAPDAEPDSDQDVRGTAPADGTSRWPPAPPFREHEEECRDASPEVRRVQFEDASLHGSPDDSGSMGAPKPERSQDGSLSGTPVPSTPAALSVSTASLPFRATQRAIRPDALLAGRTFEFATRPPTATQAESTMETYGRAKVVYKDPHYSVPGDVPRRDREYGGKRFRLRGSTARFLPDFKHHATNAIDAGRTPLRARAPSKKIEGPTQKNGSDKFQAIKGAASQREKQHMAVLTMELHANSRKNLLPDPQHDAIEAIFYCLQSDDEDLHVNGRSENTHVGALAVGNGDTLRILGITPADYDIEVVSSERMLIETFLDKVRYDWDPECLGGYEVHHASWGYLLERAEAEYGWNLVPELGRVRTFDTGRFGDAQSDRWGYNQSSVLNFTGRHVLPIWRILKADNKFQQYSFEHIAFHVLGQRVPRWSHRTLSDWYQSEDPSKIARVFHYYRNRVEMDVEMLDAAEIVDQSCESARVFGVDFHSVRTRGSQFKVESVMFKISKPESFMLLSPNRVQVGRQNAAECQPLIMEPQSAFYKGPLLVMDFQSLYPSVMIAYNYCYSTCLGRVSSFKGSNKFGVSEINLPEGNLHLLRDHITVSPNGMMFAKPEIRKSLLAKMLSELLDTRVMVRSSMKAIAKDRALTKLLNARQLALKFLANVTYGYTSATFSGRMPAVEIADAIVQTGRETLERAGLSLSPLAAALLSVRYPQAKETIESVPDWGAKVVYGDTDSLFIYLPGKSKDEAFRIGDEIAVRVTTVNPRPIKLKFEKVYLPSVLLAKKRYVGFKYEYKAQKDPDFDAKGIETVRRDGIAATQKMQETCLKLLFRTSDLSLVKSFCQRQWKKLMAGEVSPQDFIIAKAVKLGSYAEGRLPPPGAAVATRAMLEDPRAEPEYGERVPYLMFQAEPGQQQVHRAISPEEFLADPRLRLDASHYIERMMIPPLERIFNLVGADVKSWYREMSKSKRVHRGAATKAGTKPVMLEEHFVSDRCIACHAPGGNGGLCAPCKSRPTETIYQLVSRKHALLSRQHALHQICVSCSANPVYESIACDSIDCPNHYARVRNDNELSKVIELSSLSF
ncbi:DNA polymerase zeta [Rhodotorula sphaerocarpa]